jgi:hypothetical protein
MKKQGRFPLEEYGDRNVLTTWTMSYEQVKKQSEEAAYLLKLWGVLDCGELWYELVATSCKLANEMDVPAWLLMMAEDELEFVDAMSLLVRYSLASAREGASSHSMHPVVHKWCGQLAGSEEQYSIYSTAAGFVASNIGPKQEEEFWKRRERVLPHNVSISKWIRVALRSKDGEMHDAIVQPWIWHNLGHLLSQEDRAAAEAMCQQALQGKEKAIKPENFATYVPALNTMWGLASLCDRQHQVEDARAWYSKALLGYKIVVGNGHPECQKLRSDLASLDAERKKVGPPRAELSAQKKKLNPLLNGIGSFANLG